MEREKKLNAGAYFYIWMNLTFSLTGSHNSACISSHI